MKMMKIRQYVNYTMAFCLLAWGTQFLTGCAESDHLDEYQYESESGQTNPEKPTSDEITQKNIRRKTPTNTAITSMWNS